VFATPRDVREYRRPCVSPRNNLTDVHYWSTLGPAASPVRVPAAIWVTLVSRACTPLQHESISKESTCVGRYFAFGLGRFFSQCSQHLPELK
jgi:hypothetical protein